MLLSGYKTKLVKNILLVVFFLFFGKLISLAREIYFSYRYGSNYIVESFFFNFNIINLIGGILLNTIIFYLVPLVYKNKNEESTWLLHESKELTQELLDFIENEFEDNINDFDKVIVYEEECYNLPINIINL